MTEREQLIKLLWDAIHLRPEICRVIGRKRAEEIADHLLSNGVTLQRWIPVTERLPEVGGNYFVIVKYKYDFEKEYSYDTDFAEFTFSDGYIDNCWNTYNDWDEGQQYLHITHWMPLPTPPKEETT